MTAPALATEDFLQLDATRYALMRRLGFVFRHHVVGSLQPLGIMCRVMHLKLQAVPPDLVALQGSVDQANALVRAASTACLDVVSWLAVDANAVVPVGPGAGECLSHLRSSFALRGLVIQHEAFTLDVPVRAAALREVLTAAVLAAGDHAQGRSDIVVRMQPLADAVVEITLQTCSGAQTSVVEQGAYRLLTWDEVERLAHAHQAGFARPTEDLVQLRLPCGPW